MKTILHIIPFDKFAYDLVLALRKSHDNPIFFLLGKPDRRVASHQIIGLSGCNNVYYLQRKSYLTIFKYIYLLISSHSELIVVSHATDLYVCKYLLLIALFLKVKYIWHIRGNDLYRHLLDKSLPFLIRIINILIFKNAYYYLSLSSAERAYISSAFSNSKQISMICSPSNVLFSDSASIHTGKNSILLGNSATATSNISEFFSFYSHYLSENPLKSFHLIGSYGSPEIVNDYLDYSKTYNNVWVQTKFMDLIEYKHWLLSFDMAVLIPSRLQGLGLLFMLISSNVTIYSTETSPLTQFMTQYDIRYKLLSFHDSQLQPHDDQTLNLNKITVSRRFNYERLVQEWSEIQFL